MEPLLTLEDLLAHHEVQGPRGLASVPQAFPRIRLMRHAFRGHKAQLGKLAEWTDGRAKLTVEDAYPEGGPRKVSARQVLDAVRFDPKLVEIVTAEQGRPYLQTGDLVLVFGATGGKSAEFLAAFEVRGDLTWPQFQDRYETWLTRPPESAFRGGLTRTHWLVRGLGYNALPSSSNQAFRYDLTRRDDVLPGFARRLIVDWQSGVSWVQEKLDKEVLEIRPKGFVREFSGYLDFTLTFEELRAVVGHGGEGGPPGDPEWCRRLSAVSGVYIVQSEDGRLYVGSASGRGADGGFLGRWRTYASTHEEATGEEDRAGLRRNVAMRAFLWADGDVMLQRQRLMGLRFSIARTMDKNVTREEVLEMESWFKEKLGSKAERLGLNAN